MARLTRAEFMRLKQLDFVRSARSAGASNLRIMLKHDPAQCPAADHRRRHAWRPAPPILFEASLSFLGLSDRNVMSWGLMIGSSRQYLRDAWWAVTFPGLAIFLTVLAIRLVGDGLNDAFNPKLRSR